MIDFQYVACVYFFLVFACFFFKTLNKKQFFTFFLIDITITVR